MTNLSKNLELDRCPHCTVATPLLNSVNNFDTQSHDGRAQRKWRIYVCGKCGGVVSAWAHEYGHEVQDYFPRAVEIETEIPDRPRAFLLQAQATLHAPSGSVMLSASAVDAMLKRSLVSGICG